MAILNANGTLYRLSGRDIYGRSSYEPGVDIRLSVINLDVGAIKTSVRADSSASRGSSDETVLLRGRIIVGPDLEVERGDKLDFDGEVYVIEAIHRRRSVAGIVDHQELGLELGY